CDFVCLAKTLQRNHPQRDFLDLVDQYVRHVGLDEARRDDVAGYTLAGQFLGDRFAHADHAGFACGVVHLTTVAGDAGDGTDVDDPAGLGSHDQPSHRATYHERALEIGIDHVIEILVFHADEQAV